MSDFRFPGRWLNDRRVMTLSGDEFKAFVTAGAWSVENRTDGHVTPEDIEFIPRFDRSCIARLVTVGLWTEREDGWLMTEYGRTQTTRAEFEVLENNRRREREKKARQRAKSPGSVPRDTSPGTAQDRPGQARQAGQDQGGVLDWPVTPIPQDPAA